jgi:hypothetical protein
MAQKKSESNKFDRFHTGAEAMPPAHQRPDNLDPKHNGPFLDDIRAAQEESYREARNSKDHIKKVGDTLVDTRTGRNLGTGVPQNVRDDANEVK